MQYTIAALYRFVALAEPAALRDELRAVFQQPPTPEPAKAGRRRRYTPNPTPEVPEEKLLCGTLLIAPEGINGTLAGSPAAIETLLEVLQRHTGLPRADVKFASSDDAPFGRLKFHLRPEIIPFRHAQVDPTRPGRYVDPADWNDLIASPDVLLLDTRNRYEVAVGTFANAVDPSIDTFSEFATYVREHLDPAVTPRVAMFCTGGIRCEKASAFMLQEGFAEVYHLKGGILRYLEQTPPDESQWRGDCFVFDRRTAVSHDDLQR